MVEHNAPLEPHWLVVSNGQDTITQYAQDKSATLSSYEWICLSDSQVTAGQYLLSKQFPHVDGLKDT